MNAFNRGLGRAELESLVAQFNQTYAGKVDAKGATIPRLVLPERYWFGDNFHSLDLRLSREFVFAERWRLSLIGEVFNLYNAANLSGHSGNLTSSRSASPPTGQPRCSVPGARGPFNWERESVSRQQRGSAWIRQSRDHSSELAARHFMR